MRLSRRLPVLSILMSVENRSLSESEIHEHPGGADGGDVEGVWDVWRRQRWDAREQRQARRCPQVDSCPYARRRVFHFAKYKSSTWEGGLEFHPYLRRALGENPTEDEVKELEEELCSKDGLDKTEYINH